MNQEVRVWIDGLWKESHDAWINRGGQDHFYREQAIVPALYHAVRRSGARSLIDAGSGDGYTTNLLLEKLGHIRQVINEIRLADQSLEQLQRARQRPYLRNASIHQCSLETAAQWDWAQGCPKPRLLLSVFLLQELPNLEEFFKAAAKLLAKGETFLAVTVWPDYAEQLLESHEIRKRFQGHPRHSDWLWAGEYPIGVETGTIYLPHFQRAIAAYQEYGRMFGFESEEPEPLSVPDTAEARRVFGQTVYGTEIIGVPSSVLLKFKRQ